VNIPSLYEELQVRTPATMRGVSMRACNVCMLVNCVIGLAG